MTRFLKFMYRKFKLYLWGFQRGESGSSPLWSPSARIHSAQAIKTRKLVAVRRSNWLVMGLIVGMVVGLTACGSMLGEKSLFRRQDNRYLQQDQNLHPLMSPDGMHISNPNNYPVPDISRSRDNRQPPLTPPNVENQKYPRYKNEGYVKKGQNTIVGPNGNVVVQQNPKIVWGELNQAIQKAGYRVVEKDPSLGSYFVLDVASTAGTVKRNTPVYQLRVQDEKGRTQLSLLNAKGKLVNGAVSQRILGDVSRRLKV